MKTSIYILSAIVIYFGSAGLGFVLDAYFDLSIRALYWALGVTTGWLTAALAVKGVQSSGD